ncbi:MAG: C_GCAxxG_C_C family protein [Firmicutes bacterium]|nr:C_GCAxxG_C_C family protein [Bacillota bacterium]
MKEYFALPQEEKDALVQMAYDKAYETESLYGNCMQSVLNGLYLTFPDMGITPEMIKAGFGLAGGCGCSLVGTCGALNAVAFCISLFDGRPVDDWGGQYDPVHARIRDFIEVFKEEFEGMLCSEVLIHNMGAVYDWKTPEGLKAYNDHDGTPRDAEVVGYCARYIAQLIVDGVLK